MPCPPGEHHSLILADNGSLWALGSNREGQLGVASAGKESDKPLLMLGPGSGHSDAALTQPVVAVAAGARHSAALNAAGQCLCWGWELYGEHEQGERGSLATDAAFRACRLSVGLSLVFVDVTAGWLHAVLCCRVSPYSERKTLHCSRIITRPATPDLSAAAWCCGAAGQCGSGRNQPSVVQPSLVQDLGPLRCRGVGAGMGHTAVVTDQGDVYCWGLNGDGQLGDGTDTTSLQVSCSRPLMICLGLLNVVAGSWGWH